MALSTLSLVKDQDQRVAPQVYEVLKDQFLPLAGRAVAGGSALSSGGAMLVETLLPFRDDFPGSALSVANWSTPILGTGQTATVASSVLSIVLGTTINAVAKITGLRAIRPPFKVAFLVSFSQRIANQTFFLEIVSADGTMACGWQFDGTNNAQAKFYTTNGSTSDVSGAVTILNATGTFVLFEVEFFTAEVNFATRTVDATGGKNHSGTKHQHVPDPDTDYFVQLRGVNGGSAPGSSTTVSIEAVVVENHGEVHAEITGGRGDGIASKAVGVNIVGGASGGLATVPQTQTTVLTGEFIAGVAAAQMPSKAGSYVRVKSLASNAGRVMLGPTGVTLDDGTADATTGLVLGPGLDDTGWMPIDNLNRLFAIASAAAQRLTYMVLAP